MRGQESNLGRRVAAFEAAVAAGDRRAAASAAGKLADQPGMGPLMVAASLGLAGACEAIVRRWPDMAGGRAADGATALIFAARSGSQEAARCVRALLGAQDQTAADEGGMSALAWAAAEGDAQALAELLGPGSPSALRKDAYGLTALGFAALSGSIPCLAALWEAAAAREEPLALAAAAREACALEVDAAPPEAAQAVRWLSAQAERAECSASAGEARRGEGPKRV